jgi:dolichol-phosphate mannosyltransferase
MSRKFGQAACTLAGIKISNGQAVIVMDVDLQDPPELIPELVSRWEQGFSVVLAQRINRRGEPMIKKFVANFGYKFLNRFAEVPIPKNTGDFRLLDRRVVTQLNRFNEANAFLRGLVALVGFKTTTVYFHRPARFKGITKYNRWFGSFKISLNGVVGYTTALLNLSMFAGIFISFLAFLVGATYAVSKLVGGDYPIGNPTIVISVLAMGGLNLFFLGILGMYVSKIYEEVKSRPSYIIEESIGFGDKIF